MIEASVDVEAVFSAAMCIQQQPDAPNGAAEALGLIVAGGGMDVDDMARRLERAIAGDAGATAACRRLVADRHPKGYCCDAVSLGAVRALGVAPEVVAAVAIMTRELEIDAIHFEVAVDGAQPVGMRVDGHESGMRVEVDLAPDMAVVWNEPLIVLRDGLPQTIVTAARGRPLSDIITHPALADLDLRIDDAWTDKRGGTALSIGGTTVVALDGVGSPAA